jgi:hypothetical protein
MRSHDGTKIKLSAIVHSGVDDARAGIVTRAARATVEISKNNPPHIVGEGFRPIELAFPPSGYAPVQASSSSAAISSRRQISLTSVA